MADEERTRYLKAFTDRASAAGLNMGSPGLNWAPMKPLVAGSHVSLSVQRHQIQVNLNNDKDADRSRFNALFRERHAIDKATGETLVWEAKDGRKKTAIRATLDRGYEDADWETQHAWAIKLMKAFDAEFGARLRRIG